MRAEVEQLRLALGRDDAGFEIAMDDAGVMGRLHARGDLPGNLERFINRQRPAVESVGKGLAFDILEDETARAVVVFDPEDPGDVGMAQLCERPGLTREAREAVGVAGEMLGQRLDGDGLAETRCTVPAGPQCEGEMQEASAPRCSDSPRSVGATEGEIPPTRERVSRTRHALQQTSQSCTKLPRTSSSTWVVTSSPQSGQVTTNSFTGG